MILNNDFFDCKIICDFDGTITSVDTTDAILSAFAPSEWEEIEQLWVDGQITARECMFKQIALLKVDQRELDAFLQELSLTKGFLTFANFLQAQEVDLLIVSDGLDYTIEQILARHNLSTVPVMANHLLIEENSYSLSFPYSQNACPQGVCKCKVLDAQEKPLILIGDGRSDFCLAEKADLVLARRGNALEEYCQEKEISYFAYDDFYEVLEILKDHRALKLENEVTYLNILQRELEQAREET